MFLKIQCQIIAFLQKKRIFAVLITNSFSKNGHENDEIMNGPLGHLKVVSCQDVTI